MEIPEEMIETLVPQDGPFLDQGRVGIIAGLGQFFLPD